MRILFFLLFTTLLSVQLGYGQTLRDFKKKTEENTKERTAMLDLLRADIKNYLEQDVVFVVNHFKVYGTYAWMEGTVQRKDGKEIIFTEDAYGAFSTDVWYVCIVSSYPEASRQIFSEQILSSQENCTD